MPDIDKDVQKEAVKEAIKEWLNEQVTEFGWWTLKGLGALAFAGMVFLALKGQGWTK